MKPEEIKVIIREELRAHDASARFSGGNLPKHFHNGLDTPKFPFANLQDASNYIQITRTTLTPAQVKALHTTPITLVPKIIPSGTAPRAVNICLGIAAYLNYAGTAYTGANNLEFRYTNGSGTKVTTDMSSAFLDSAASAYDWAPAVATELTPVANAPIVVAVPVANPGAGTSNITFVVFSRIISF